MVILCVISLVACGTSTGDTSSTDATTSIDNGAADISGSDVQVSDTSDVVNSGAEDEVNSGNVTNVTSGTGNNNNTSSSKSGTGTSSQKTNPVVSRQQGGTEIKLQGSDTSGRVTDLKGRVVRYQVSPLEDKTSSSYKRMLKNIENIEKQLNCKIQLVENLGESGKDTSIVTSVLAGTPIVDIWIQNTTDEFVSHFRAGMVQNLSDLYVFNFAGLKWDACMENMQYKGKYYGVRPAMAGNMTMNSLVLCFNSKLLREYIPQYTDKLYEWQKNGTWTWEKFEEVCKAFNQAASSDPSLTACFDRSGAAYLVMLANRGVDWLKRNEKGQLVFNGNDKKAQEAMNQFKDLVSRDIITFENAKNVNFGWDANMVGWQNDGSFLGGQCLFAFNQIGGYYWNVFQHAGTEQSVRSNAGFMMVPKLKESDDYTHALPVAVQGFSIPFGVDKPAEVATVLNLLQVEPTIKETEQEQRQSFVVTYIEPTLNKSTSNITSDAFNMTYDGFSDGYGYALQSSMGIAASTNIWGDDKVGWIGRYLYDIAHGDIAISAAVAAVNKKYNNILADLFETR